MHNSRKLSNLEQLKKKFQKFFISKKSLKSQKKSEFSKNLRTNLQNKFNSPRIFKNLKSDQIVIFYMLNNNFFYTQVASTYILGNTNACLPFRNLFHLITST